MNVLALGAVHGPPEASGLDFVESIQKNPIAGYGRVDGIIVDEPAVEARERSLEHNMATSSPGDPNSPDYQHRKSAEIIDESAFYDVVLEIHDAPPGSGEFVILNWNRLNLDLLEVATLLKGINHVLISRREDVFGAHISRLIGVELCREAIGVRHNVQKLRDCAGALACQESLTRPDLGRFKFYDGVAELTATEAHEANLDFRMGPLAPFQRLPDLEAQKVRDYLRKRGQSNVPDDDLYGLYWWGRGCFQNGLNGKYFGYVVRRVPLEELEATSNTDPLSTAETDLSKSQQLFSQ